MGDILFCHSTLSNGELPCMVVIHTYHPEFGITCGILPTKRQHFLEMNGWQFADAAMIREFLRVRGRTNQPFKVCSECETWTRVDLARSIKLAREKERWGYLDGRE